MSRTFKIAFPLALALGFLVYLVYSSLGLGGVSCEVCVEFAGRSECRTATATNAADATATAVSNACSLVTSGRDELIPCLESPPISVQCDNS
jgi:uncharacterized membrane protein YfcA